MRTTIYYTVMTFCLIALFCLVLNLGAVEIPIKEVLHSLFGGEVNETNRYIVLQARLPFALTAIISGAGLSAAGLMMQTTFHNPLAGPSILGVSSGASLGVALLTLPVISSFGGMALPITGAVLGAGVVVAILSLFSAFMRSGLTLLIVGIMISYLCSALISLLNFFAPANDVKQFAVWGMGSFAAVTIENVGVFAICIFILLAFAFLMCKPLNAMLLGERYAMSMGYSVRTIRTLLLVVAGLLTAIITAYCGPIGFIGLIVPHIARMAMRSASHTVIMPASVIMGAVIALFCAFLTVIPCGWGTLPINAVTPLLGVPVILYLLINTKRLAF